MPTSKEKTETTEAPYADIIITVQENTALRERLGVYGEGPEHLDWEDLEHVAQRLLDFLYDSMDTYVYGDLEDGNLMDAKVSVVLNNVEPTPTGLEDKSDLELASYLATGSDGVDLRMVRREIERRNKAANA